MRHFLTALLMLFMFTTAQVAVAFERCDDPSCAQSFAGVQKKTENDQKDLGGMVHCAASCHQSIAMPYHSTIAARAMTHATISWSERLIPESIASESLIEPPSLA